MPVMRSTSSRRPIGISFHLCTAAGEMPGFSRQPVTITHDGKRQVHSRVVMLVIFDNHALSSLSSQSDGAGTAGHDLTSNRAHQTVDARTFATSTAMLPQDNALLFGRILSR